MARLKAKPQLNPIVGDDLMNEFWDWLGAAAEWGESTVYMFCRWLLETQPGQQALNRINDMPRQLFLDWDRKDRPWEVVDD